MVEGVQPYPAALCNVPQLPIPVAGYLLLFGLDARRPLLPLEVVGWGTIRLAIGAGLVGKVDVHGHGSLVGRGVVPLGLLFLFSSRWEGGLGVGSLPQS